MFLLANFSFLRTGLPYISRIDGLIFLALLALFLFYSFRKGGALKDESGSLSTTELKLGASLLLIAGGIAGLFFGGKWIVDGANQLTEDFGLSQSVVGMTIIAATTSLPELVTSIMAALKKNSDLAVGNAIGSNLFNILLVLGVSALIEPIPFDKVLNLELGLLVLATLLILLFIKLNIGKTKRAISSLEGILLIATYVVFLVVSLYKS